MPEKVDKILRWFIEGKQGGIKQQVGGTYILDADYVPLWVHLSLKRATIGNRPLKVDIMDDGVSIFDDKPALVAGQTDKVWTTIPADVIEKGSVLTCNRDQVAELDPGEDLTVELGLEES
jgi:hypothetical protein